MSWTEKLYEGGHLIASRVFGEDELSPGEREAVEQGLEDIREGHTRPLQEVTKDCTREWIRGLCDEYGREELVFRVWGKGHVFSLSARNPHTDRECPPWVRDGDQLTEDVVVDAIEQMNFTLASGFEWISVEDRWPKEGQVVLFVDKTYSEATVECGQYSGTTFYSYPDDNPPWGNVTHWRPLPEPPKQG